VSQLNPNYVLSDIAAAEFLGSHLNPCEAWHGVSKYCPEVELGCAGLVKEKKTSININPMN
jgi:hypothetical protein